MNENMVSSLQDVNSYNFLVEPINSGSKRTTELLPHTLEIQQTSKWEKKDRTHLGFILALIQFLSLYCTLLLLEPVGQTGDFCSLADEEFEFGRNWIFRVFCTISSSDVFWSLSACSERNFICGQWRLLDSQAESWLSIWWSLWILRICWKLGWRVYFDGFWNTVNDRICESGLFSECENCDIQVHSA